VFCFGFFDVKTFVTVPNKLVTKLVEVTIAIFPRFFRFFGLTKAKFSHKENTCMIDSNGQK
jgi:hypothetical protein